MIAVKDTEVITSTVVPYIRDHMRIHGRLLKIDVACDRQSVTFSHQNYTECFGELRFERKRTRWHLARGDGIFAEHVGSILKAVSANGQVDVARGVGV